MTHSSGSPLALPGSLDPREPKPNGIRFRQLLRDEKLIPFLAGKIGYARAPTQEVDAGAVVEFLRRWLQPWLQIGLEAAPEESAWLDDLVQISCQLILLPAGQNPATVVDAGMLARSPEATAWACLLAEDAGLTPPSRRVEVPVVFIFQSTLSAHPLTASDQVARLELRHVPGADELHVHPADRWRRSVRQAVAGPGEKPAWVEAPGSADPDFLGALTDALQGARSHLLQAGEPLPLGAIVWRLLDFHSDVSFRWQNSLQGPSVGGAALRGFLRLLGPRVQPIDKYTFVLAQLRDTAGHRSSALFPVEGVRQKIENAFQAVAARSPALAHQTFFVLSRPLNSGDFPTEVGPEQINGNVQTIAELAQLRSPFDALERSQSVPEPASKSRAPEPVRSHAKFGWGLAVGTALSVVLIVVMGSRHPGERKVAQADTTKSPSASIAGSVGTETDVHPGPAQSSPAQPDDAAGSPEKIPSAPHGEKGTLVAQMDGTFLLSYTLNEPGNGLHETRLSFKVTRPGPNFPATWRAGPPPTDHTGTWIWIGDGAQMGLCAMLHLDRNGIVVWAWLPPQLAAYFAETGGAAARRNP